MKATALTIATLILFGCTSSPDNVDFAGKASSNTNLDLSVEEENSLVHSVEMNSIRYKAISLTALEFLKRKGENPAPEDVEELVNEHVLIFDIQANDQLKNLFESDKIQFSKEDAISYLAGAVSQDVELFQGGESLVVNGVQSDISGNSLNKVRLFIFTNTIYEDKSIIMQYNDELFGAGIINLKV